MAFFQLPLFLVLGFINAAIRRQEGSFYLGLHCLVGHAYYLGTDMYGYKNMPILVYPNPEQRSGLPQVIWCLLLSLFRLYR